MNEDPPELPMETVIANHKIFAQNAENPQITLCKLLTEQRIERNGSQYNLLTRAIEYNELLAGATVGLQSEHDLDLLKKIENFIGCSIGLQEDERTTLNGKTFSRPKIILNLAFVSTTGRWAVTSKYKDAKIANLNTSTFIRDYPGDANQNAIEQAIGEVESSLDKSLNLKESSECRKEPLDSIQVHVGPGENFSDEDIKTPKKGILKTNQSTPKKTLATKPERKIKVLQSTIYQDQKKRREVSLEPKSSSSIPYGESSTQSSSTSDQRVVENRESSKKRSRSRSRNRRSRSKSRPREKSQEKSRPQNAHKSKREKSKSPEREVILTKTEKTKRRRSRPRHRSRNRSRSRPRRSQEPRRSLSGNHRQNRRSQYKNPGRGKNVSWSNDSTSPDSKANPRKKRR